MTVTITLTDSSTVTLNGDNAKKVYRQILRNASLNYEDDTGKIVFIPYYSIVKAEVEKD
jgi:hypothetical protein